MFPFRALFFSLTLSSVIADLAFSAKLLHDIYFLIMSGRPVTLQLDPP